MARILVFMACVTIVLSVIVYVVTQEAYHSSGGASFAGGIANKGLSATKDTNVTTSFQEAMTTNKNYVGIVTSGMSEALRSKGIEDGTLTGWGDEHWNVYVCQAKVVTVETYNNSTDEYSALIVVNNQFPYDAHYDMGLLAKFIKEYPPIWQWKYTDEVKEYKIQVAKATKKAERIAARYRKLHPLKASHEN